MNDPIDPGSKTQRARAIWAFSPYTQDELAELAGLDAGRVKAMMGKSRPAEPSIEELVSLAKAALVPREFAERGWEGLWEPDAQLLQDVTDLKQQVSLLQRQVVLLGRATGTLLRNNEGHVQSQGHGSSQPPQH